MPVRLPLGHAQSPIQQVTHVRQDLLRCPAIVPRLEIDISLWGIANDFPGTIGNGGQGMAKKVARADSLRRIHGELKLAVYGRVEKKFSGARKCKGSNQARFRARLNEPFSDSIFF